MSWQQYVDEHLMCEIDGHTLTAAAIIGHDGSVWSKSATFPQFKPEEIAAITSTQSPSDNPKNLSSEGLENQLYIEQLFEWVSHNGKISVV